MHSTSVAGWRRRGGCPCPRVASSQHWVTQGKSRADWSVTVSRPGDRGVVSTLRKVGAPKDRMLASSQSG